MRSEIHDGPSQSVFDRFHTPESARALYLAGQIKAGKGSVRPEEALALHHFAHQYDRASARFVELGTLVGYTALIMADAAPRAEILTLNPAEHEVVQARANLAPYPNVQVIQAVSWDMLPLFAGAPIDLLFIDGDHKRIAQDMPWLRHMRTGGLALFHDFDSGSPRVVEALDRLCATLGRPLDVRITPSDSPRGLAGLYIHEGDQDAWERSLS